jgi:ribonuclease HI
LKGEWVSASKSDPSELIIHCDGGARNNPGPAGFGYVIWDGSGRRLEGRGEFIGTATNNVAEYKGLIAAAARAVELDAGSVTFRVDSELLERQISGRYRVKSPNLKPLFAKLMSTLKQIDKWRVEHVRREYNADADLLANQAMDARGVVT